MTMQAPSVAWFRSDLRLADNPALAAAASRGTVIPLYILDDGPHQDEGGRAMGMASRWWLDGSLRSLARDLAAAGAPLILRRGPASEALSAVIAETGARAVFWNRLYDPASLRRDRRLKADLLARGVDCQSFNAGLLNEPWDIRTASGDAYRVFTPYWRTARTLAEETAPGPATKRLRPAGPVASDDIDAWALRPRETGGPTGFDNWRPGEAGALSRLEDFLAADPGAQAEARNRPAASATSRLSPHLHFGEVSPRQVWLAARGAVARGAASDREVEAFLRELGWREFNHHLLFHFPEMARWGLNDRFRDFPWKKDPAGLEAWRRGKTGFPIVDAGMRELMATGWMHNRVRMISASFLVKDLLVDWRHGEAWFWETLVDADLANNVAGWQWVAGCGADPAPFFRVFNPVLQGEKFDPDGDYVRRWVPELARLPNACIHQPWRAGERTLAGAGVRLGENYPAPIVDHAGARLRALAAYETSK
jgi:deoxyribodipyrimidine photo-lyase